MWAQCPGIIEAVGQTWLGTIPLISGERFLKSQPGNALAWAPLPWGAGRDTDRGPPGSPDKHSSCSAPRVLLSRLGASLEPPPNLCLPLPWSPRPGLRLLKRLQPLSDLILLLFSSAPLWGSARPPKKPRPAPGDRDPRGVGGRILSPRLEGSWRRRGFSGVAAGVAAPRNKSSVRLAAPSSCWGGFSRP